MSEPTHAQLAVYDPIVDVGHDLESTDPLRRALAGLYARYSGKTLHDYTTDMDIFLTWCASNGLHPLRAGRGHLELYIRWMETTVSKQTGQPWAKATINRRFGTVALFYKYAAIDDLVGKDPSVAIDRPKVVKEEQHRPGMSPLMLGIFMDAAERYSPTAWALVALLGGRGLRIAEACSLDVASLSDVAGYTMITFVGKGSRRETIPLAVPVARAVRAAIDDRPDGPVLLNRWGNRMSRANASRLIEQIARTAALPAGVTPHVFRRGFCMTLLASGVDVRDVMLAMRHKSPDTTIDYDQRMRGPDRDASHRLAAVLAGMRG